MDADRNVMERMVVALNRLLQIHGGDCEQGIPNTESNTSGVGARTFIQSTQFNGTLVAVTPTNIGTATPIAGPAFALHFAEAKDSLGNIVNGRVRVYFHKPSSRDNDKYTILRSGQWIKRRRGFDEVYIVADNDATTIFPVIKVATDPSFEILGDDECCDLDGAPLSTNFFGGGTVAGTYPTYVTLFDTGDPTAGFSPPNDYGSFTGSIETTSAALSPDNCVFVEFRHMLDNKIIAVESIGLVPPVQSGNTDGSDFRTVWSGKVIKILGNRLVVAIAGTAAGVSVNWAFRWGVKDVPKVSEVTGRFAYDGAGTIVANTPFARFGVPRSCKTIMFAAVAESVAGATAFNAQLHPILVTPTAVTGSVTAAAAGATGALGASTIALTVAGSADTAVDQNAHCDGFSISNVTQLVAGDTGVVRWRATMINI